MESQALSHSQSVVPEEAYHRAALSTAKWTTAYRLIPQGAPFLLSCVTPSSMGLRLGHLPSYLLPYGVRFFL